MASSQGYLSVRACGVNEIKGFIFMRSYPCGYPCGGVRRRADDGGKRGESNRHGGEVRGLSIRTRIALKIVQVVPNH